MRDLSKDGSCSTIWTYFRTKEVQNRCATEDLRTQIDVKSHSNSAVRGVRLLSWTRGTSSGPVPVRIDSWDTILRGRTTARTKLLTPAPHHWGHVEARDSMWREEQELDANFFAHHGSRKRAGPNLGVPLKRETPFWRKMLEGASDNFLLDCGPSEDKGISGWSWRHEKANQTLSLSNFPKPISSARQDDSSEASGCLF